MEEKVIWLTMLVSNELDRWNMEIVGAFETESEAVKVCKAWNYCVGPLKLGEVSPVENVEWPGAYYPLADS